MFPIRDHNPAGRTPYVTYALIAANVVIFVAMLPAMGDRQALAEIYYGYGVVPTWIVHGEHLPTLVTSMFLHGGWMHIAGNMLFLWIFGDNLEDQLGHVGFTVFYLVCGIGAALMQVAAAPDSQVPVVGASGAIAGVMGGYLLLFPRARVDVLVIFIVFFRIFALPAWIMLALWFALQAFSGATVGAAGAGVAYWAHMGGFVIGLIWVVPLWLRGGGPGYWRRTHGHPPHPGVQYRLNESRIPVVRRRR